MTRLLCCLAALSLAACGASGALYLPDQAPPKPNAFGSKERKLPQQSPAPAAPDAAPATPTPATAPNP